MTYKLLAMDMDGTLLMDNKDISSRNLAAIRRARKYGVEIVLCTGRPYVTVEPYLKQLGIDCWVVTNNGGVTRNKKGQIIEVIYMQSKALEKTISVLLQEKVYFHISDEKDTFILNYSQRLRKIYEFILKTGVSKAKALSIAIKSVFLKGNHKKVDFSKFVERGRKATSVFIISSDSKQLRNIGKNLAHIKNIDITSSGFNNLEVLDEKATKGRALANIAKMLGLNREQVIAVGDNYNDLSMIEYAGLGIAMKNSEHEVIKRADWVTTTNEEDGIAHLIEHFIGNHSLRT